MTEIYLHFTMRVFTYHPDLEVWTLGRQPVRRNVTDGERRIGILQELHAQRPLGVELDDDRFPLFQEAGSLRCPGFVVVVVVVVTWGVEVA